MSFKNALRLVGVVLMVTQAAGAAESAFIDKMPQLAPDTNRAGAMTWIKPGVNPSNYQKVIIEPITIFISPDSDYKGMDANDLKTIADGFNETVAKVFAPEIAVTDKAGPGTLYLRAALTNVKLEKKKRGLLGYTPVGIVVTAARDLVGARISLTNAVLEVETIDSVSGERLGVLIDKAPEEASSEKPSWDAIDKTFSFYAARLKGRMLAK